jgi:hypothetical protein
MIPTSVDLIFTILEGSLNEAGTNECVKHLTDFIFIILTFEAAAVKL